MTLSEDRLAVAEAVLCGDISADYLTDREIVLLAIKAQELAFERQLEKHYKQNPGLTFSGTETELCH